MIIIGMTKKINNMSNYKFPSIKVMWEIEQFIKSLGIEFDRDLMNFQEGTDDGFEPIYSYDLSNVELTNEQIVDIENYEQSYNEKGEIFVDIEYKGKY